MVKCPVINTFLIYIGSMMFLNLVQFSPIRIRFWPIYYILIQEYKKNMKHSDHLIWHPNSTSLYPLCDYQPVGAFTSVIFDRTSKQVPFTTRLRLSNFDIQSYASWSIFFVRTWTIFILIFVYCWKGIISFWVERVLVTFPSLSFV